MSQIKAPRGVPDVLPPDSELLSEVEAWARTLFDRYGYRRIETPIFEPTEVFVRGAGESSDFVVNKEMYTFEDRSGRSLTLRPEGTSGVARAVIQHELHKKMPLPLRLSYIGPMFRYEQPQANRTRQLIQFGVECFGSDSPLLDAEVILWGTELFDGLGLEPVLLLNSLGCADDRARYADFLREQLSGRVDELCEDCRTRLQVNPLRVLDCKNESCRAVVRSIDPPAKFLCDDCREHFGRVKSLLESAGVSWVDDEHLVRGLDYYTRTIFEFDMPGLGARSIIGAGGRYDGLVEQLGGPALPAVGMSPGAVPLLNALKKVREPTAWEPDVFVAWLAADQDTLAFGVARDLRKAGLKVIVADEPRSLQSQMRAADRLGASRVVILGPRDVERGVATVRDLATKEQQEIPIGELAARLC